MHLGRVILISALLALAPVAFAQCAAAPAKPMLVPAGEAVRQLHREATEVFRAKPALSVEEQLAKPQPPGPETACDFAQRRNLNAKNEDVVRVVLRRLNFENAGMDAYVRWQMLSFNPKFEGVIDPKDMKQILTLLPQYTMQPQYVPPPAPEPSGPPANITIGVQRTVVVGQHPVSGTGGSRPKLAVETSGVSMGSGGAAPPPPAVDADALMAEIREKRKKMSETNKWVAQFREALIPMLPEAKGIRLTTMLQDVGDRLGAGDPSCEDAIARLMAVCEALPKPGDASTTSPSTQPAALSMELRRALAEQAKWLGNIATPVIKGTKQKKDGEVGLEGHYMKFPPEQFQRMLALLAGEPVPPAATTQPATEPASEPTTAPAE